MDRLTKPYRGGQTFDIVDYGITLFDFIYNNMMKGAIVIEGHVQGLSNVRSLGELGAPIYVVDVVDCIARYSKYCVKFLRCPSFNSEAFIDFLIDLAKRDGLSEWFLVPSNDHAVENLSKHQLQLRRYYKLLVPEENVLRQIIDKGELMKLADSLEVPVPKTCYYETVGDARDFRFPLLIKGRHGLNFYKAVHAKVIQIDLNEDLERVLKEMDESVKNDVMIQEMIPENSNKGTISYTCFAISGIIKTYWIGEKIREHPIKFGTATMSQSVMGPDIQKYAESIIKALLYTGTCEIEFMFDARDHVYKLIEINPRTWLWVGLAKACGVDYAKIMYRFVNDIEQKYPDKYSIGIKWRNALTDSCYGLVSILKGSLSFSEYLKSLRGVRVCAVWDKHDILPGLFFPFLVPFWVFRR